MAIIQKQTTLVVVAVSQYAADEGIAQREPTVHREEEPITREMLIVRRVTECILFHWISASVKPSSLGYSLTPVRSFYSYRHLGEVSISTTSDT